MNTTASASTVSSAAAVVDAAAGVSSLSLLPMNVLSKRPAQVVHPTGDPKFSVLQAFPAAITAEEADPFLMMDYFSDVSRGLSKEDEYPVDWHPHRGFAIATYITEGLGRHADSLGNRETFTSPGMQWCETGSGIEHAEGGATPAGETTAGFQIWVNVPSAMKMLDPKYGTVSAAEMPIVSRPGVEMRLLAGPLDGLNGPFLTVQPIQMIDFVLAAGATIAHAVPLNMDNAIIFIYKGSLSLGSGGAAGGSNSSSSGSGSSKIIPKSTAVHFDARDAEKRGLLITAGADGASFILFAGEKLNQPIAWRGPFVMTTEKEIAQTVQEYRSGAFPPVRTAWDYRRLSAFPSSKGGKN